MIFTYPADHPRAPDMSSIYVDPDKPFDVDVARRILDASRFGDVVLTYGPRLGWWRWPEIGKLCDFLGYRGAEIIHIVGKYDTNHNAYLADRLEKLYTEDILDAWAKV